MLTYREKAESLASRVTQQWSDEGPQDVRAITEAVRAALVEEANLELRQVFAQMGGQLDMAVSRQKRGDTPLSEQKLRSLLEGVDRATAILDLFLDPAAAAKLTIRLDLQTFDLAASLRTFLGVQGLEGKIDANLATATVHADEGKLLDAIGHLVTRFYFAGRRHERAIVSIGVKDGRVEGFVGLTPSHLGVEELMEEIRVPMNVDDVGIEVGYVRAVIERHGGSLFVATAGESSTGFGFTLPLPPEAV